MKIYFKLIRPLNCLIALLTVIAAALIASKGEGELYIIILAGFTAFLSTAAGNSINDYFDIEIDKINRPSRPLPSGLISRFEVLYFYLIITIISLITAGFINQIAFAISLFASLLMFIYSFILKKHPLIGNVTVSFLTGVAFLFGGISVGEIQPVLFPALLAFNINFIREIVKDVEDLEGDKKCDLKTFPIKFGIENTQKILTILFIVTIIITYYPFMEGFYSFTYFIIISLSVIPILLYGLYLISKNIEKEKMKRISSLLKVSMFFGLIAIYLAQ